MRFPEGSVRDAGRAAGRVFKSYDQIALCCDAWNRLIDQPWRIMSPGIRDWGHRNGGFWRLRSRCVGQSELRTAPGALKRSRDSETTSSYGNVGALLILLCHKRRLKFLRLETAWQHGHRKRDFARAIVSRLRIVAIELAR